MGNICYKFLLVVLRTGNLLCHIIQAGGKIADFVLTVHLKFIVHIAGSILLSGIGDFTQRLVNHFRKKDKNNHGKQEEDNQCNIRNI